MYVYEAQVWNSGWQWNPTRYSRGVEPMQVESRSAVRRYGLLQKGVVSSARAFQTVLLVQAEAAESEGSGPSFALQPAMHLRVQV